ncbi:MAG: CBS domain-containing protein [Polyangiaceae bacterium]|nr:CBS domain-containing protein [Polyangiaceae bacterium]
MSDDRRAPRPSHPDAFETRIHVLPAIALAMHDALCETADAPIDRVRAMMLEHGAGALVVVDGRGRPLGMISPLDLVTHPGATTACEVMTSPAVSVHEMTSITRAAAVMAYEGIDHLPVVDDGGSLVAILSSADIMRHLGQEQGFLVPRESRRRRHIRGIAA